MIIMRNQLLSLISFTLVLSVQSLHANQPLQGAFTVSKSCQAFSSIRKQKNPIDLKVGQTYEVVGKNKQQPSHYRINVDGSKSQNNWVAVECGALDGKTVVKASSKKSQKRSNKDFLLAMSWQPGFCLTHNSKKECRKADSSSYSASKISLHGLWPQPRNNAYCGVSEKDKTVDRRGRWDLLEPLKLSSETKKALKQAMPGFVSDLQRHEWIKHGTCYSDTPETYYKDSITVTQAINNTKLDELFTANKGKTVSQKDIQKALAETLGKKAAASAALRCGKKNQITEIWIGLRGDVANDKLQELMESGKQPKSNCKSGKVSRY